MVASMDTVLVVAPAAVHAAAAAPVAGRGMDYSWQDVGMHAEGNYKIQTFGLLMVLQRLQTGWVGGVTR